MATDGFTSQSGRRVFAGSAALTFLISSAAVMGASAATPATSTTSEESALAIEQAMPEVFEDLVKGSDTAVGGEVAATALGLSPSVPLNAEEGITLDASAKSDVTLGLPFSKDALPAVELEPGVVMYDNGNGTETVPAIKDDGSLQIATVIRSAGAPREYAYPLDLPAGGEITLFEGGQGAVANDASGALLFYVAPPRAFDADGIPVGTRYSLEGNTLVQHVQLAEDLSYPVVADPWLGRALIARATVTYPSGNSRYKVNVTPSTWGKGFVGPLTWGAWESELKTKLGGNASKVTYVVREQLNCHLAGFPLSLPEFNLESWRVTMTWSAMAPYNCNYPEGGWGSVS